MQTYTVECANCHKMMNLLGAFGDTKEVQCSACKATNIILFKQYDAVVEKTFGGKQLQSGTKVPAKNNRKSTTASMQKQCNTAKEISISTYSQDNVLGWYPTSREIKSMVSDGWEIKGMSTNIINNQLLMTVLFSK